MRARRVVALLCAAAVAATAGVALAASTLPVLRTAADEGLPAAGGGYFAWTEATRNTLHVYARTGTEARFRVNPPNTFAATGGIEGTTLVYQELTSRARRSDIVLYDLPTRTRRAAPAGTNTGAWEWAPTIAAEWILFTRGQLEKAAQIVLVSRTGGRPLVVDRAAKGTILISGQVNGDFAVWFKCPRRAPCTVYRYQISARAKIALPRPAAGISMYSPGVLSDGTVYYVQSGPRCGERVSIARYGSTGAVTLHELARGRDVYSGFATREADGSASYYYETAACTKNAKADIYRVSDTP